MVAMSFNSQQPCKASLFYVLTAAAIVTSVVGLNEFYTAGVVEFRPVISGMSSADMLQEHLQAYLQIIHSEEANETDILVFPEGTLNNAFQMSFVPSPHESVIPCLQTQTSSEKSFIYVAADGAAAAAKVGAGAVADFMVQLSCAARSARKYVVINLTEKENCPGTMLDKRPCASNGLNVYNSNVVFDREGRVVSRYRKFNLYVEQKNTTEQPEFAVFESDFGVRFAHFICFDILFYTPAQALAEQYGIKDFIFTSWFYSELPFLTAVQLQQSWSWANNVNLLASGGSYPLAGATGSGIYAGNQGALVSTMQTGAGERKLYVARVPKNPTQATTAKTTPARNKAALDLRLLRDPNLSNFTSELLKFSNDTAGTITKYLCQQDFCCSLHLKFAVLTSAAARNQKHYFYRFGVYKGSRSYEKDQRSDLQICAIYSCTEEDINSCGRFHSADVDVGSNYVLKQLELKANFVKALHLLIMPNTLTNHLLSLNSAQVFWNVNDNGVQYKAEISLKNEMESKELYTFGIYANYYERSSADNTSVSLIFTTLAVILTARMFIMPWL